MQHIATVEGGRTREGGWSVSVDVPDVVSLLTTPEERAALLEQIACAASRQAADLRQKIASEATR